MERDFMGLNSKDSAVVKEEFVEGCCDDTGSLKSSGVQWPLSDAVFALPNFMPLKSEQDEKPSRMKFDLSASHGHIVKSGSDLLEAMHKRQSGDIQSLGGATMKQQFLAGNPLAAPHSLPSPAFVVGTAEQWNNSKPSGVSAQMTIFYDGTVNVFDDISAEKAQAIMLLAGTWCIPSSTAQSKLHMKAPASKLAAADQALINQNMAPGSGLPSPMSVSSHPIDQSGVQAANNNDAKVSKTTAMSATLVNKGEPPKVISSTRPMAASDMISSAVPQARKASLARFLEKRKERVMNAAPYNLSKRAADCATPESNGVGCSATSEIGSSSVSVNKEISTDI